MIRTDGHMLLKPEGLETNNIPQDRRNSSIVGFFEMREIARKQGDDFFAEESLYSHDFSFGPFYPGFVNLDWNQFSKIPSLKGISQITYESYIKSFWESPCLKKISVEEFNSLSHTCFTGFDSPKKQGVYICDSETRNCWHEKWYSAHQELIKWDARVSTLSWPDPGLLFPCIERTVEILQRELRHHNVSVPSNPAQVVLEFHDRVMRHKGPDIHAYAHEIGSQVCVANYYREEHMLSDMEAHECQSFRKVFSLLNPTGKRHFLSIDFKHGMFELIDSDGCHIKEVHFDGTDNKNKKPQEDHSLRTFERWCQMGCPQ